MKPSSRTCEHCGKECKKRVSRKINGKRLMVGVGCARNIKPTSKLNLAIEGERFFFGQLVFDVVKAMEISKSLPIQNGKPTYGWIFGRRINKEHAAKADLSKPVLFATLLTPGKDIKEYNLLIDGNHRVKRAVDENKEVLVQVLGIENTLRILEEPSRSAQYKLAKKAGFVSVPLKQIISARQDTASSDSEIILCGDCFNWAYENLKEGEILRHGLVRHPTSSMRKERPKKFAHAWIERDGLAIDWQGSIGMEYHNIDIDLFYKIYKPTHKKFYDYETSRRLHSLFKGSGPWHPAMWKLKDEASYTPIESTIATKFSELAGAQRGEPERAMLRAQDILGGGVMSFVIEHIGDLTHRMTTDVEYGSAGYGNVEDKVQKTLRTLNHKYEFEREHAENMRANAQYLNIDYSEFTDKVNNALIAYSKAHEKLHVYNKAQWLARQAAIKLGEQKFNDVKLSLYNLKDMLKDEDTWWKHATEFDPDYSIADRSIYTPTQSIETGIKIQDPGFSGYKTSLGSTYDVGESKGLQIEDWYSTIRTKSIHAGHEKEDVGKKRDSHLTLYIDKKDSGQMGMPENIKTYVMIINNAMYHTDIKKDGKIGKFYGPVFYSTIPVKGSHPMELWGPFKHNGILGFKNWHNGNEIVEIFK